MHLKYGLIDIDTGFLVDRLFMTEGLALQWLCQYKAASADQDTYRVLLVSVPIKQETTQTLEALS